MATEMTAGFDIWNWKPGPDETPVKSVTQITSFYDGEAPITGQFDIYQVNDGTNNRLVAFDTEYMEVFDEVSSSDGNNTFKIGGAAYASANAATGPEKNHNEWMPVQGVDTPVATGVTITLMMVLCHQINLIFINFLAPFLQPMRGLLGIQP